ncbi:hypothetical protein CcaverHIS002_0408130 [Cutaneotrichosporon cavernicola]|uniref:Uncharacterized protein n=1 Tax=Cutaneotrichosporon cavernicola TaxID=279322 RepID=A0AA48L4U2_9TREE|nr:uncharacterized protein CcaverHIS019_0408110 [Cutaneotrichosporon cavernicola]BEI84209.1 hypothetical protein CcaverHIS002_0408130 [Cutaneotrichosporon cavernicola]BEI91991.1 hypothetical protein CcaverHIS019_0408110 [Cutaneotrichosporon cavernicola]BEI99762.1 hypothetical protein CcaverHIS631_0408050 [Cutaneotrichosporon cavernicola]BEJ07538.1 hypothetical protein CcaverHIS641_0408070 [Cutaneotrichosporon cavernicola]
MAELRPDLTPHSRPRTTSSKSHRTSLRTLHRERPVPTIRIEHDRSHSAPMARLRSTSTNLPTRPRRLTEPAGPTPHPFSAAACTQRADVARSLGEFQRQNSPTRTVSAPGYLRTKDSARDNGPIPVVLTAASSPTVKATPDSVPPMWSPPPIGSAERAIICPFEPQWILSPLSPTFPTLPGPGRRENHVNKQSRAERSKSATYGIPPVTLKKGWFRRRL